MRQLIKTITDEWYPPRDRVLWAPVFLGVGIALYFGLGFEPAALPVAAAAVVAGLVLLAAKLKFPALFYPMFLLFLVVVGFGLAVLRTHMVDAPLLSKSIGITRLEGRIVDISTADTESDKKVRRRVTFDELSIEKLAPEQTPRTVRLSSYHMPNDIQPGARVSVLARLMPPSGPVAPDGFDYRRQAFFDGIGAVGFTLGQFESLSPAGASSASWFNVLGFNHLRQNISARIAAHTSHPNSSVAMALLAGERASIPDSINQNLIDSGLYHLLSISGLHVATVCGFAFFTVRLLLALLPALALRIPIKKIAAVAAICAGLFYSMLAGMPVPTQRAMMMTGLALVAIMLDRSALSMRTIALAAFFVLALQPETLVGVSFQLSFAAVLSMVAFHEGAGRKLLIAQADQSSFYRMFLYFAGIAVTTILVTMATTAPVLHHFGRVQLYGLLANAVAIPLTSFVVMPAGMAAMLAMPLGLEAPFLRVVDWGIQGTLDIASTVASLPHAALTLPGLPLGAYLTAMAGFLFVCLWQGRWRWVGAPVMVCAIVLGMGVTRPFAMIDGEGRILAAAGGGQIAYVFKTPTSYIRKNWLALWGGQEFHDGKPIKTTPWQAGDTSVVCDDHACRIESAGARLSVLKNKTYFAEECNWAGVIVVLDKALDDKAVCSDAPFVTFWSLRKMGGMAFYAMGEKGVLGRGIYAHAHGRPWS